MHVQTWTRPTNGTPKTKKPLELLPKLFTQSKGAPVATLAWSAAALRDPAARCLPRPPPTPGDSAPARELETSTGDWPALRGRCRSSERWRVRGSFCASGVLPRLLRSSNRCKEVGSGRGMKGKGTRSCLCCCGCDRCCLRDGYGASWLSCYGNGQGRY